MSQNIEIEFKNMLTEQEFAQLRKHLHIEDKDFFTQINYYFDTPTFFLKNEGCALRIREKSNQFELTLKQPHPDGLLETNHDLQPEEAKHIIKQGYIDKQYLASLKSDLHFPEETFKLFGSLLTSRAEKNNADGLIVLDNSEYLNKVDFELEYEVLNRENGLNSFKKLLKEMNIPIRKTENKVKRLFREVQKRRIDD